MNLVSHKLGQGLIMSRHWPARLVGAILAGLIGSCGSSERPTFLQVQLCVVDNQGLMAFVNLVKEVARAEKMTFIDGSEETLRAYRLFRDESPYFHFSEPVTNIGIEQGDETMLIGGNIQEQSYNIVIGFSEGQTPSEGRNFAQKIVAVLKQRWPVETVPAGQGAFPMESCKNVAQDDVGGSNP